jgi:hypothetical protein
MMRMRNAFMTMDALAGLFLLAALATALAVAAHSRQRAAENLATQRSALAATQRVIAQLQTGQPEQDRVSIVHTGRRLGSGEWVEVSVEVDGRRVPLLAVTPATGGTR